jgi:hypothetical protein
VPVPGLFPHPVKLYHPCKSPQFSQRYFHHSHKCSSFVPGDIFHWDRGLSGTITGYLHKISLYRVRMDINLF